ncbi:MAG: polysulfide reductase NrfD [Deltaproteobacteria bacterium]|nr:polysulfide reductase NrfD [Candidatus Anaeroferrophillus wilburensis]MBN2888338.1 polysulfide reductase NrfD [Deltaproteobacteria bacterium]
MGKIVYDVQYQTAMAFLISYYFYCTGLSAGSFMISTLSYGFGFDMFKPAGKMGVVAAVLLLLLAPMFLLMQVGWPIKSVWNHFVYLNPTSAMTYGAFLIMLYPLNSIIYGIFMFKGNKKWTKFFGTLGIPLALAVHGYTGWILALGVARDYWNTGLMPIVFLFSAMVSGISMMILLIMIRDRFFTESKEINLELIRTLAKILGWLLLVDLFLVFCDYSVLIYSKLEAQEVAHFMLFGKMAFWFVIMENLVGKVIPMVIVMTPKLRENNFFLILAAIMNMIGILVMRIVTVYGGQALPLM